MSAFIIKRIMGLIVLACAMQGTGFAMEQKRPLGSPPLGEVKRIVTELAESRANLEKLGWQRDYYRAFWRRYRNYFYGAAATAVVFAGGVAAHEYAEHLFRQAWLGGAEAGTKALIEELDLFLALHR